MSNVRAIAGKVQRQSDPCALLLEHSFSRCKLLGVEERTSNLRQARDVFNVGGNVNMHVRWRARVKI